MNPIRYSRLLLPVLLLAAPLAQAQSVVYSHAFDDSAGWPDSDRSGDLTAVYTVVGSEYLINPLQSGHYALALAPAQTGSNNQRVEADIRLNASNPDSRAGVACRVEAGARFYAFNLIHAGGYEIARVDGSGGEVLRRGPLPADAEQGVRVRAECNGSQLSFSVNGQLLDTVEDSSLSSGLGAGLISVSPVVAATNAAFDNFSLSDFGGAAARPTAMAAQQLSPRSAPPAVDQSGAGGGYAGGGLPVLDDLALFNDGGGRPGARQSLFESGQQRVYVVMEMSGQTQARFRAEWRAVQGSQESVLLNGSYDNQDGHSRVWLYADRQWTPGLYRVDVYANEQLLDQREFSIY